MEISSSFLGIGWKILKNDADGKRIIKKLTDEAYHDAQMDEINKIQIKEYPCFVFVHAYYDESTGIEIIYLDDLKKMIATLEIEKG